MVSDKIVMPPDCYGTLGKIANLHNCHWSVPSMSSIIIAITTTTIIVIINASTYQDNYEKEKL